jgi:hypothetical protein
MAPYGRYMFITYGILTLRLPAGLGFVMKIGERFDDIRNYHQLVCGAGDALRLPDGC